MYRQVHYVGKKPTLRAVLLRHQHRELKRYDSDDRLEGGGEDPLKPFVSRLRDVSCAKAIKQVIVSADFDNSDGLYECISEIAKDLYNVNNQVGGTATGRSQIWKSIRMSATPDKLVEEPKSRARICNIQ